MALMLDSSPASMCDHMNRLMCCLMQQKSISVTAGCSAGGSRIEGESSLSLTLRRRCPGCEKNVAGAGEPERAEE